MNATFTREPSFEEKVLASKASSKAKALVSGYADEVSNGHEWNNTDNIQNTKAALLAYIAELEGKVRNNQK